MAWGRAGDANLVEIGGRPRTSARISYERGLPAKLEARKSLAPAGVSNQMRRLTTRCGANVGREGSSGMARLKGTRRSLNTFGDLSPNSGLALFNSNGSEPGSGTCTVSTVPRATSVGDGHYSFAVLLDDDT